MATILYSSNTTLDSNLKVFPLVRANTRETRSFTEQNVSESTLHIFSNFKDKNGYVVGLYNNGLDNRVIFNICGRFFDWKYPDFDVDLSVGVNIDNETKEITEIAYGPWGDVQSYDYKIGVLTQVLNQNNTYDTIISPEWASHLYIGNSTENNAYQTSSQIANTYATQDTVGNSTDEANVNGNLYQKVKAILAINTIDGGTIS